MASINGTQYKLENIYAVNNNFANDNNSANDGTYHQYDYTNLKVVDLLKNEEKSIYEIEDVEKRKKLQFISDILKNKSDKKQNSLKFFIEENPKLGLNYDNLNLRENVGRFLDYNSSLYFFDGFIDENPELLDGNYNPQKLDNYVDSFLSYTPLVEALRDCRLEKEKVVDNELSILFEECLYRTNNKDIQHWEILKIYTNLGRSIEIAETVSNKLFCEIEKGEINGTFSFNLEVSDLMNEEFLNKFIKRYEAVKKSSLDSEIVVEVLENQVIEDVDKFEKILERMKDNGIVIAIDDTMQIGSHLESINEVKKILENHNGIKVIKICGKYLQNLYKEYNNGEFNNGILNEEKLIEIQRFIKETISSGIFVVGEWIENGEIFKFAGEILGVSHFQGYAFKNMDNSIS